VFSFSPVLHLCNHTFFFFVDSSHARFKASAPGHWTLKNIRTFMEKFAKSRNMDPLRAKTWYSSREAFCNSKVHFIIFYFILFSNLRINNYRVANQFWASLEVDITTPCGTYSRKLSSNTALSNAVCILFIIIYY